MKRLLVVGMALMLGGCANNNNPNAWKAFSNELQCKSGRDCQIMMGNAYNYIRDNTIEDIRKSTSAEIDAKKINFGDKNEYESIYIHKTATTASYDTIRLEVSCHSSYCFEDPNILLAKIMSAMNGK